MRTSDLAPSARLLPEPRVATRRNLGGFALRAGYRLTVMGIDRVPTYGPLLLVVNHPGVGDALVLAAACPRPVHVVEPDPATVGPLLATAEAMGAIAAPHAGGADRQALELAVAALDDHRAVAVLPEGLVGRGDAATTGDVAGYLAARRPDVPVIPVAVLGTRAPGAPVQSLPHWRAGVVVAFGQPCPLPAAMPAVPAEPTRADVAGLAEHLRQHLHDHVAETVRRTGVALPDPREDQR